MSYPGIPGTKPDATWPLEDSWGAGSELHLDTDEWGELLYWLKKGLHQSESGHRAFLQSIVTKLEAVGIKSND